MDDSHENIITQKEISDEPNKNENNILINSNKNNIINNENEKTEEDIIMITNSCLDEQSFFQQNNKKTELTKLSEGIISNLFQKNNQEINSSNIKSKYDDFIIYQKFSPTKSELKKNKNIIKDLIKRNNYNKKYEENDNKNNDNNSENENNKENKKNFKKNYCTVLSFLEREKRFEIKKNANKERKLKQEDDELLNNIQEKPNINKNSSIIANKNNKNMKVYNRLYKNPTFNLYNQNLKSKNKEYINIKTNNNNNIKKVKKNINKSQDLTGKKKDTFKNKNDIRSFSSNDVFKKEDKDKDKNFKTDNFLSKNNSRKSIKKFNISKEKNNNNKISKSNNKIKNRIIKDDEQDKLFNIYNSQTATDKMKIIQIKNLNITIDDLLSKENIDTNKKGINFFLFCILLFKLGFVDILHYKININEVTEEYIKELLIQPYLIKSLITKEFILNELEIIKSAFNSIINNFKIIQESNINNMDELLLNNIITFEDFKLFIFILSDLFTGFEKDKKKNSERVSINVIKTKTLNHNISTYSSKTNKSVNINNNKKNNLISKIVSNKQLDLFTSKDIINYKNYFKYMIDIKNNHINFINNLKKETKKENIEKSFIGPYTFSPKINDNNDIILSSIKPNMNFEERNEIISKKKNKHKLDIQNEIDKEYLQDHTFIPKLNGQEAINYLKNFKKKIEKEKKNEKKNNINAIKNNNEEDNKNMEINDLLSFSFNPILNKPPKQKMFSQSPLANDKLFNLKIQEMRKTNFSKKLNNYEKNNREILSNDVKKNVQLLNYFLNNKEEGRMILGLEKHSNKDTFDIFIKQKKQIDEKQYKCNVPDLLNSKRKNPLFVVEIKIKNENNVIEVFPNDNYEKVCLNFCNEHKLGVESYNQILESIRNKINEINKYTVK